MSVKSTRMACGDCGKPAPASAYGEPFCLAHYREQGFDDPKLLGGRRPSDAQPSDDDGEPRMLVDVAGSEAAVVERFAEEFDAVEITTGGGC